MTSTAGRLAPIDISVSWDNGNSSNVKIDDELGAARILDLLHASPAVRALRVFGRSGRLQPRDFQFGVNDFPKWARS